MTTLLLLCYSDFDEQADFEINNNWSILCNIYSYKLTLKHLIFYFSNKFSKSNIFENISTLHSGIF